MSGGASEPSTQREPASEPSTQPPPTRTGLAGEGSPQRVRPLPGIPRYLRPRPDRVLALPAPAWTVVIGVAFVGAVEVMARSGLVSRTDLVPVSEMAVGVAALLVDPEFLRRDLLWTVGLIVGSFLVATLVGVLLAYSLWRIGWWRRAVVPFLSVYYAVPTFALYPILVVLLGIGPVPILAIAVAFSTGVIAANALTGFDSVSPVTEKLARALRLRPGQYFGKVLLPSAVPDIASGMKLGFVYALIGVLATEFILSTRGLGHFISDAYVTFSTGDMYAGILFVCLFALAANLGLAALLNRFDWKRR